MRVPLWLDTISAPKFSQLTHDRSVDVCIVGAGMAGVTLAYLLKDTELNVALIDSDEVLHGTSAYTTAKITAQHNLDYHKILNHYGEYQAKCYANAQLDALDFIEQTIKKLNIDCDFEKKFQLFIRKMKSMFLFLKRNLKLIKNLV